MAEAIGISRSMGLCHLESALGLGWFFIVLRQQGDRNCSLKGRGRSQKSVYSSVCLSVCLCLHVIHTSHYLFIHIVLIPCFYLWVLFMFDLYVVGYELQQEARQGSRYIYHECKSSYIYFFFYSMPNPRTNNGLEFTSKWH